MITDPLAMWHLQNELNKLLEEQQSGYKVIDHIDETPRQEIDAGLIVLFIITALYVIPTLIFVCTLAWRLINK